MGIQIQAAFNFDIVLNLEKNYKNTEKYFCTLLLHLQVVYILPHLLYHSSSSLSPLSWMYIYTFPSRLFGLSTKVTSPPILSVLQG